MRASLPALLGAIALAGCSSGIGVTRPDPCAAVTCAVHASCIASGARATCVCDPGMLPDGVGACAATASPAVGGCALFPADHLFNTPIDALPSLADTSRWLSAIGDHPIHLDLGTDVDPTSRTYYGIPFNVVSGGSFTWPRVFYGAGWPDESDCVAAGAQGAVLSPCTAAAPVVPVPASPLVEGGTTTASGDHHLLAVDADGCRLWELFAATPHPVQAMKAYGMYLADAGSTWYVQGEPSADWDRAIFGEVQTVRTSDLEAVDLLPFTSRAGFDVNSARVPPP